MGELFLKLSKFRKKFLLEVIAVGAFFTYIVKCSAGSAPHSFHE